MTVFKLMKLKHPVIYFEFAVTWISDDKRDELTFSFQTQ